jgi:DNA replication protein DnaC
MPMQIVAGTVTEAIQIGAAGFEAVKLIKTQRDLQAVKLLIVDELGYVPLSSIGAELLFEVFSQRYERGSTIVTSNLPFEAGPRR